MWERPTRSGQRATKQVKGHYESLVATGKNRLEFEVSRVVADQQTVITEGVFRHAYTGQTLLGRRFTGDDELDPNAWYLAGYKAFVVWRMTADGLIEGEDIYTAEPPRVIRRLTLGERPHLGPVNRD